MNLAGALSSGQGFPPDENGESRTGANELWTNISAGDKSCLLAVVRRPLTTR